MKKIFLSTFFALLFVIATFLTGCKRPEHDNFSVWTTQNVYKKATSLGFEGTTEELVNVFKGNNDSAPNQNAKTTVSDVFINAGGKLIIRLSNNKTINCGIIKLENSGHSYAHDKNLLKFIFCVKTYIENANIIYANVIKTSNYTLKKDFTYIEAVDFYTTNKDYFSNMQENFAFCKGLYDNLSLTNNKSAIANLSSTFSSLKESYDSFKKIEYAIAVYTENANLKLIELKKNFTALKETVNKNSPTDLVEYEKEFILNNSSINVSLENFLNKATTLYSLFIEANAITMTTSNIFAQLNSKHETKQLVDKHVTQIESIKSELLNKHLNSITSVKITEIYVLIDTIYSTIFNDSSISSTPLNDLLDSFSNNILILTFIDKNIN